MANLSRDQIRSIARQVVRNIRTGAGQHDKSPIHDWSIDENHLSGIGIFNSVSSAVRAARKSHLDLMELTLEKRGEIITNIRTWMLDHAEKLARKAHDETGLGRMQDKIIKNKLVTRRTPGTEVLKPEAVSGDRGLMLMERAPYGVIGSITPCTNPTSTIICNTIGMIAAGNSVVFNVHPTAKKVSNFNIELMNKAIIQAGGPENLVTAVADPTIESARELMSHPGIDLLVVTGGAAVVKAAMTSGKRAICAGPGNPPVVVDETADMENAARSIVNGASLDNNIICVLEKETFVVESVADQLLAAFQRHHAVILKTYEIAQLEKIIFTETKGPRKPGKINKTLIGKPVQEILQKIGKSVDDHIKLAIAPVEIGHPLVWTEQMMPVMPLVRVPNVEQAIQAAKEAEHGFRHTAMMHSKNLDNLSRMAREMNCSIFVKNGPSVSGLGYGGEGYCSFTIASPTGEGLTYPVSFTRERRCVLVDHFRII